MVLIKKILEKRKIKRLEKEGIKAIQILEEQKSLLEKEFGKNCLNDTFEKDLKKIKKCSLHKIKDDKCFLCSMIEENKNSSQLKRLLLKLDKSNLSIKEKKELKELLKNVRIEFPKKDSSIEKKLKKLKLN